ncbi:DUF6053 domain-containing protein [Lysobacter enzymogenes]|uniref:DUF6053 domain-containing protein n=1 Tax=Lysobacter enzymogenes TaxID=69 RepID=UPI003D188843
MLVCVLSGLVHLDLRAGTSRRGRSPRPGCTGSPKLARPRGAAMSAPGRAARRQIGQAGGVQAVVGGPSGLMFLFVIAATWPESIGPEGPPTTAAGFPAKAAAWAEKKPHARGVRLSVSRRGRGQKMSNDSSDGAWSSLP